MILIDGLPLTNGHSKRGIGHYVCRLLNSLQPYRGRHPVPAIKILATSNARIEPAERITTWRPQRPRSRLGWAINAALMPYDFRDTQPVRLFHATDPAGLCRPRRLPMLATAYDLIPLKFPRAYLDRYSRDERFGYQRTLQRYQRAEHIVAISESTRRDFVDLLGVDASKISVVYPSIDIGSGVPAAEVPPVQFPASFFLYVGALDERKNVAAVLESYAGVRSDLAEDFVLVGKASDEERELLRRQIDLLGIAKRVHLFDYVPDALLVALYARATALVFLSRFEGFGLPVLEAMAHDCPVICSDAGALCEVAAGAAEIVALDQPTLLANAMARLSSDPSSRTQLKSLGRQRASQFSFDAGGRQMAALYQREFGLTLPGPALMQASH